MQKLSWNYDFNSLLYEYGISWGRGGKLRIDATALIGVLIPALYYLLKI